MAIFRRNTIFHVEETLPDPEELKLRFRRRVLLCAAAAFLIVLGAPVARDLRSNLHARAEARRFAERLLEARTLAAQSRLPVSLEIEPDRQGWLEIIYGAGEGCTTEAPGPRSRYVTEGVYWKVQAQQDSGGAIVGQKLCWHPAKGLMLDSTPLDQGKLLVSLSTSVEEGAPPRDQASVLVTQGGAEMQTVTY